MTSPALTPPRPAEPRMVRVALAERSYDVIIGRGLLADLGATLKAHAITGPFAVVHDDNLLETAAQMQNGLSHVTLLNVPSGERYKSLIQLARILRGLAKKKIPRSGALIALGGGVVGDLAGFAAASYLRGIPFVQIPTTLLAMVDSSVGGKTGINLPEGKNLVGAFYQPKLVIADLDTLGTLPPREFAAGMAEVVKYGAIADRHLFDRVAGGVSPADPDLVDIIARCVAIKAHIVEQDEFETTGLRATLNFGHTIGHAIEKATGYTKYLHGEAISIGMRAAAWLSVWNAGLPETEAVALESALVTNNLPVHLDPAVNVESVMAALGNDKKVGVDGHNRWVLIDALGHSHSQFEVPLKLVERAITDLYQPK